MFADARPAPAFVLGDNVYEIDVLANQKIFTAEARRMPTLVSALSGPRRLVSAGRTLSVECSSYRSDFCGNDRHRDFRGTPDDRQIAFDADLFVGQVRV